MKILFASIGIALCISAAFAQKRLKLEDLPAAAKKTVQEQLKGGEIKNIGMEKEKGVTQYEIETMLNGKHRDFNVDTKGALLVVEEETPIDSIPQAAKESILRTVGAGKLGMVETVVTQKGAARYEAAYKSKDGKPHEVLVKADGSKTRD